MDETEKEYYDAARRLGRTNVQILRLLIKRRRAKEAGYGFDLLGNGLVAFDSNEGTIDCINLGEYPPGDATKLAILEFIASFAGGL
jgi:hypothetical protein